MEQRKSMTRDEIDRLISSGAPMPTQPIEITGLAPHPIHYAPESDDVGVCGLSGYLVERTDYVTCLYCIDRMRADNIALGLRANGSEVES